MLSTIDYALTPIIYHVRATTSLDLQLCVLIAEYFTANFLIEEFDATNSAKVLELESRVAKWPMPTGNYDDDSPAGDYVDMVRSITNYLSKNRNNTVSTNMRLVTASNSMNPRELYGAMQYIRYNSYWHISSLVSTRVCAETPTNGVGTALMNHITHSGFLNHTPHIQFLPLSSSERFYLRFNPSEIDSDNSRKTRGVKRKYSEFAPKFPKLLSITPFSAYSSSSSNSSSSRTH